MLWLLVMLYAWFILYIYELTSRDNIFDIWAGLMGHETNNREDDETGKYTRPRIQQRHDSGVSVMGI